MADIAYVPTIAELLYLALVLYAWSGKIVGWAMAGRLRAELVLDAIARAVDQPRPKDLIPHSEQAGQYTSAAFGRRCGEAGVRPSIGLPGDAAACPRAGKAGPGGTTRGTTPWPRASSPPSRPPSPRHKP